MPAYQALFEPLVGGIKRVAQNGGGEAGPHFVVQNCAVPVRCYSYLG